MQSVMSVDFNKKDDLILGGSTDHSVKVWSMNGRIQHSLMGHIGKVYTAKFSASDRIVSGSHDRTLKIWDLTKGYCVKTLFTLSSCNDLCILDNDGNVIVSGHLDNGIRIWYTTFPQGF